MRGPRWAEGATLGPAPCGTFLRVQQVPSVARKTPTCLRHQSTQTINHPLQPAHHGVLGGAAPHRAPPRAGRTPLGPSWAAQTEQGGGWLQQQQQVGQLAGPPAPSACPSPVALQGWACSPQGLGPLPHCRRGRGVSCHQMEVKSHVLSMAPRACPHLPEAWVPQRTQLCFWPFRSPSPHLLPSLPAWSLCTGWDAGRASRGPSPAPLPSLACLHR